MKSPLVIAALLLAAAPALAGDVSVSIGINQPGFYGQITLGDFPRPQVIYSEPMVIERAPGYRDAEPIYLHVPPGHEKHWRQHCAEYHACARRVYFVQDHWYRDEYARHEAARREHGGDRREERHDERRDDRRHDAHDNGHGHGHDKARDEDRREGDRGR